MKFLSVRELRAKSAQVWKDLPEEGEMVVTSNGRPVAIISATDESRLEESLSAIRRARAIEAVFRMQRASGEREAKSLSMDDINGEIAASRKKRKRPSR